MESAAIIYLLAGLESAVWNLLTLFIYSAPAAAKIKMSIFF
eukprot:SAG31_NODE_1479_length_8180_cov_7.141684_7_plen_41_part_00